MRLIRSTVAVLIAAGLTLSLVACGGSSASDTDPGAAAEAAMVNAFAEILKEQGGPAYQRLVPEQAALIDRELYISCIQDGSGLVAEVTATDSYTETLEVPAVGNVETWAVTVEITAGEVSMPATRHLIERDGAFYTLLSQEQIDTYAAGTCL